MSLLQNARDTQMTTRVTGGARWERHEKSNFLLGLPSSFLASRRSRARASSLNLRKRENMVAYYLDNTTGRKSCPKTTATKKNTIKLYVVGETPAKMNVAIT